MHFSPAVSHTLPWRLDQPARTEASPHCPRPSSASAHIQRPSGETLATAMRPCSAGPEGHRYLFGVFVNIQTAQVILATRGWPAASRQGRLLAGGSRGIPRQAGDNVQLEAQPAIQGERGTSPSSAQEHTDWEAG
ncbi:hypothetical protein JHW43_000668 [Diplocarpon mali]|nr:hypothetical protein JHW43_000668 [Diplocarpon mali]